MEDLARLVAIIMLGIIMLGGLAAVSIFASPRNRFLRFIVYVFDVAAIAAGGWLALLDVGIGARIIGVIVLVLGGTSVARMISSRDQPTP